MPAPPAYAGELCRNAADGEEHDLDIARLGTYYGLCGLCRPKEVARRAERRLERQRTEPAPPTRPVRPRMPSSDPRDLDGMRAEVEARTRQRPKLRAACEELVVRADRLQEALDDREAASLHARVVLSEFKEALQVVGRTAQSLLNLSGSNGNGDHRD